MAELRLLPWVAAFFSNRPQRMAFVLVYAVLVTILLIATHMTGFQVRNTMSCPDAFTAKFLLLDSGFDERAHNLYQKRYSHMEDHADQITDFQFRHSAIKIRANGVNSFWAQAASGEWEPQTYRVFDHYISQDTTLVDFGTWAGVTLLYGAQLARRSYGLEADAAAYAECLYNLRLNADTPWYSRVQLVAGGVGVKHELLEMRTTSPVAGGSGSSFGKVYEEKPTSNIYKWSVMVYPLPYLFNLWEIDPDKEHVFVKVDVESFECKLVPHWADWLSGFKRKPTFYLSMHEQVDPCSEEEYAAIAKIVKTFKFVSPGLLSDDKANIVGRRGEFVLSDYLPPPV